MQACLQVDSVITSSSHAAVRSVRRCIAQAHLPTSDTFYCEGIRHVTSLAESGRAVHQALVSPELLRSGIGATTIETLRDRGVPITEFSRKAFEAFASRENPQGLAAIAAKAYEVLPQGFRARSLWIALHRPQDPGNLGTIIRTCDGAGVDGVILIDGGVDPYHPTAIRAALGSTFFSTIVRTTSEDFRQSSAVRGSLLIGTSDRAKIEYRDLRPRSTEPIILLLGSERHGLPDTLASIADASVRIPMHGRCDSLNLGVSASILTYHFGPTGIPTTGDSDR